MSTKHTKERWFCTVEFTFNVDTETKEIRRLTLLREPFLKDSSPVCQQPSQAARIAELEQLLNKFLAYSESDDYKSYQDDAGGCSLALEDLFSLARAALEPETKESND